MASSQYCYFRPNVLGTSGYCNGVTGERDAEGGSVRIALVLSGNWGSNATHDADMQELTVEQREITEAEALSDFGT